MHGFDVESKADVDVSITKREKTLAVDAPVPKPKFTADGADTALWRKVSKVTQHLRILMIVAAIICLLGGVAAIVITYVVPYNFARITTTDYTLWNGVDEFETIIAPIINTPILFVLSMACFVAFLAFLYHSIRIKRYMSNLLSLNYDSNWMWSMSVLYAILAVCMFMLVGITNFAALTIIAIMILVIADETSTTSRWLGNLIMKKENGKLVVGCKWYIQWRPFIRSTFVVAGLFAVGMVYMIQMVTVNTPVLPAWWWAVVISFLVLGPVHGIIRAVYIQRIIDKIKKVTTLQVEIEDKKLPPVQSAFYWLAFADLIVLICVLIIAIICFCCSVLEPIVPLYYP